MNCLNLLIESNCLLKTRNYLSARRGAINRKTLFLSIYMPCSKKCKNLVRQECSERTCFVFENDESEKSALICSTYVPFVMSIFSAALAWPASPNSAMIKMAMCRIIFGLQKYL